jgi:hypothetical protein
MDNFIQATLNVGGQIAKITRNLRVWITLFKNHPARDFLVHGCAYGFDWQSEPPAPGYKSPNYVQPEFEGKVDDQINEELQKGQYIEVPREKLDTWVNGITPIGIVDKARSGFVKYRVVHNYSAPKGTSVNDLTPKPLMSLPTLEKAIKMMSPYNKLAKIDLSNAYRSIPLAQRHWANQAFTWKEKTYLDLRLPFGNRAGPALYQTITDAIIDTLKSKGYDNIIGYLDDYLMSGI